LEGDVLHVQVLPAYNNNNRGTYTFTGSSDRSALRRFPVGAGKFHIQQFGKTNNYLFTNDYSFFFEDTWRVAQRLTLNLGLRYELPMPPHDKYGRWTNFIPELGKLVIASDATLANTTFAFSRPGQKLRPPNSLPAWPRWFYPDYKDFAPRFGLAWRPSAEPHGAARRLLASSTGTQEYNDIERSGQCLSVCHYRNDQPHREPAELSDLTNPFPVLPSLTNNSVTVNGFRAARANTLPAELEPYHGA